MQTNYTPKMSLRNKIVTGGLAGLMILISAGCGGGVKQPVSQEQTYTPDQIKAWYDYMGKRNQEIEANNKAWYNYMERRNQEIRTNNQNYLTKSQADRDADVIDDMNGRFGADMATTGFLKAVTDYSK